MLKTLNMVVRGSVIVNRTPSTTNYCRSCFKVSHVGQQVSRSFSTAHVKSHFTSSDGTVNIGDGIDSDSYIDSNDLQTFEVIKQDMTIIPNFLTEDEEVSLFKEVETHLRKLKYEFDHWDDAIHGYRETERRSWNDENKQILERVQQSAFDSNSTKMNLVHVLDLEKSGYIKPHIDSIRFCGDTIAGLCLLSPAVMRLVNDNDRTKYADCLLDRRSLYVMKRKARYEFTHEILKEEDSKFKGNVIEKGRRISVICRCDPLPET